MIVTKENIKKKLLKRENTYCSICRKKITEEDVENGNFTYAKSTFGEHFAHDTCFEELPKVKIK